MPQERLFLSLLATTGMRPSEVGNLTWERFNDTEYADIRFFTLFDTVDEIVQLKNQSSRREVPLHPELHLPPKSSGRLFDYRQDDEGLSATAAGHIINPVLRRLVKHPNKSIRSFRRTFKTLLRDLNVGEEVHDAITGHSSPSASRKNYGGMGIQVKFKAIAKIDLSFLGKQA
jgi:integrase